MPETVLVSFGEVMAAQRFNEDLKAKLRPRVQEARRKSSDVLLVFTCNGFTQIHADVIIDAHNTFKALLDEELPAVGEKP